MDGLKGIELNNRLPDRNVILCLLFQDIKNK